MKIGILTQPLHTNYGGLLQAYALQETLKQMGHEPWILQREKMGCVVVCLRKTKEYIWNLMGREYVALTYKEFALIQQNTDVFVERYISPKTKRINSKRCLKKTALNLNFEAYVVGSDQVWRPSYSPSIANYFLDFAANEQNIKRVAYAASFGVDFWEYSRSEERKCTDLASLFNGISVREVSGVSICEKYLGVVAQHVLDPTMLLERSTYEKLVEDANESQSDGNLFCYFLDENKTKQQLVTHLASALSLQPFFSMPKKRPTSQNLRKYPDECIFPSVTKWLRAFMDAEVVITDSYHGCVFSIIFNKPFWVLANKHRGMARFYSLLKSFDLEERLIASNETADIDVTLPINWEIVNARRDELKNVSLNFLNKHIS